MPLVGNVRITLLDNGGQVMWSWHIWLSKNEIGKVSHNISGYTITFLDTCIGGNVGASGVPYCLCYQWGRKDPFTTGTTAQDSSAPTIGASIQNPTILYNTTNWCDALSSKGTNYWDANLTGTTSPTIFTQKIKKTIYDPCPCGYTVPHSQAFSNIRINSIYTSTPISYTQLIDTNGSVELLYVPVYGIGEPKVRQGGIWADNKSSAGYMYVVGTATYYFQVLNRNNGLGYQILPMKMKD